MPSKDLQIGSITFSTSFEQWVGTKDYWVSSLGRAGSLHVPFNICTATPPIRSPALSTHPVPPRGWAVETASASSFLFWLPLGFGQWGAPAGGGTQRTEHLRCLFPSFPWRTPTGWLRPATKGPTTHRVALRTASLSPVFVLEAHGRWQPYCS